jgi:hypothetical protein
MPNNLFKIDWTTSDNTSISGINLAYKPQTTNLWANVSLSNTATTYTFQDNVLDYNIPYTFRVEPICLPGYSGGAFSQEADNIVWKCPEVQGVDYDFVVTDSQMSLWIDYPELYNCDQVIIELLNSTGSGAIQPLQTINIINGTPVSCLFDNLNDGVTYTIRLTLVTTSMNIGGTHYCESAVIIPNPNNIWISFTTIDSNVSKKYWILSGGHTTAETCSIKYQFVAETQASYMGNPVTFTQLTDPNALISLYSYGNYGIALLGPYHPTASPQISLGYLRVVSNTNTVNIRVYEFNYLAGSIFGAFNTTC